VKHLDVDKEMRGKRISGNNKDTILYLQESREKREGNDNDVRVSGMI
jgi:hypothetical protein